MSSLSFIRDTLKAALCPTPEQAQFRRHLEAELDAAGSGANQSMRFGNLPAWAQQLGALVGKAAAQHGMLPQQVSGQQYCWKEGGALEFST